MPASKKETSTKKQVTSKTETVEVKADPVKKPAGGLSVTMYSLLGKEAGSLDLPKEIFGAKINTTLLAQALRVYLNNQKTHFASTKTRGEVSLTTKKIYKQKGTGGARHGSKSAPIYVGGGVALGPKYRKTVLDLPVRMKKAALISGLSQKLADGQLKAVLGLDKMTGKTKEIATLVARVKSQESSENKKQKLSVLFVTGEKSDLAVRAIRNMKGVSILPADLINVYEVIKHQSVILTKESVEVLEKRLKKGEK